MKNYSYYRGLWSFLIVFGLSLLIAGVPAQGDNTNRSYSLSLCDYTIPETIYQSLDLGFNYHFYDDPAEDNDNNINRGSASGSYTYLYANPDYSLNLNASSHFSLSESEFSYDAYGTGRYNMYLAPSDLFAFGGLGVNFSDDFSEIAGVKAITGTGYGRFKNVTPMAKAKLINITLLQRAAILRDLPEDIVRQIARKIGGITPETEMEALVDEIVSLIEEDESLEGEKLGPIDGLRIREIIEDGISQRLCGWEVRGGLAYEVLDPQGAERDFLVDAAARFARPFTPYSQLFLEMDFASTLELTEDYTLNGLADYTYRLNDNLDTKFQYSLLYRESESGSFYYQNLLATAELKLRQNVSTSITFSLSDATDYEEMAKEITVGLSYDLI